jgi:hypothetical protein
MTGLHWQLGGSAWSVSRHTVNPKLAVSIAVYMTTDTDAQIVGTMPAYGPAAEAWAKSWIQQAICFQSLRGNETGRWYGPPNYTMSCAMT